MLSTADSGLAEIGNGNFHNILVCDVIDVVKDTVEPSSVDVPEASTIDLRWVDEDETAVARTHPELRVVGRVCGYIAAHEYMADQSVGVRSWSHKLESWLAKISNFQVQRSVKEAGITEAVADIIHDN